MRTWLGGAAAFLIMVPGHASSQDALTPAPAPAAAPAPAVASPAATRPPLDLAVLATLNGRQGQPQTLLLSEQDLVAANNGNAIAANRVSSGQISIGRSAFDGFAGVGNFVINSGHNNNLQGAITINIVQP